MKFFLAGIMQGSHRGADLHAQDYRASLVRLLLQHFPQADVYDPLADHSSSLDYDESTGREVFFTHNRMCGEVDVVVAFVPEASMGTAIEMWEAYRHGRIVVTISPLELNWTVRFCSHLLYPTIDAFADAVVSGELAERLAELQDRLRCQDSTP